jgi:hypothetical protein
MRGPAALAGARVGRQGAAGQQAVWGDGVDAEQIAVRQGAAGFASLEGVVVARTQNQVARAGQGAIRDADRRPGVHGAQVNEVVADAAGQLAAQRVVGRTRTRCR